MSITSPTPPEPALPSIFVSYAHADEEWKKRLLVHLHGLEQQGLVKAWHDDLIRAGDGFEAEICQAMEAATIAVFLVSPNFLASKYIMDTEVPYLLQRREASKLRIVPIIARPCDWPGIAWLKGLQLRPKDAKPLSGGNDYEIDTNLTAIAKEIRTLLANDSENTGTAPVGHVKISPPRLRHGAERLFGRETELAALDAVCNDPAKRVLTIVAWGGEGKTSLVVEWMARKSAAGWPGFERVFEWSFYSQGTRQQSAVSTDTFINEALEFFGDQGQTPSTASPQDKGTRLAQLVSQRPSLLVLDGLEPLQYPPGSMGDKMGGKLKDPAVEMLLRGLNRNNPGLCIVTTRESVTDLAPFHDTTAPQWKLQHLPIPAGVELLDSLGVLGTKQQLRQLVEDVDGHALTLNLLGRYLVNAHKGDIRRRDRVHLDKADATIQGGHAFKAMAAYETWLTGAGDDGKRQLAVLRLLGLFDRPADAGCLAALRREPAIDGLTEPLVGLDDEDWNLTLSDLADLGLVPHAEPSELAAQSAIDAHPLIREYFAVQLRKKDDGKSWRDAHRRLYEYLKDNTKDKPQPTLEDLQPLYQAVVHGCQAGMHEDARAQVYRDRILRGTGSDGFYSIRKLGAFGSDLGAVACFFDRPWSRVSPSLKDADQAWLLSQAACWLRALGRLTEALEPMRASGEMYERGKIWKGVSISYSNLSELQLTLGEVAMAMHDAEQAVSYADRSKDESRRMLTCTTLGGALLQAGRRADASTRFHQAEQMQAKIQPEYPLFYSTRGFNFCDLLLSDAERTAWRSCLHLQAGARDLQSAIGQVEQRAMQTIKIAEDNRWLLDIALDHLTLGRSSLYAWILDPSDAAHRQSAIENLQAAVDGLRRANSLDHVPRGLLSRAWCSVVMAMEHAQLARPTDAADCRAKAQADLDEAWEIAERGPMPLFMADIHLYRARLFHSVTPYPWTSPNADLTEARNLIEKCNYHRRDEELADADQAAKTW